MKASRAWCLRSGTSIAALAVAISGWSASARGQNLVFDPYRPYQGPYNAFSQPDLPNNLALPNAAREAGQYNSLENGSRGGSRYNTFDRYINDDDSPYAPSRRPGADASGRGRGFVPNREGERRLIEREEAAAQLQAERDRLYRLAIREKDPLKRAQIAREIARLKAAPPRGSDPATARAAGRAPASAARPAAPPAGRTPAPRRTTPSGVSPSVGVQPMPSRPMTQAEIRELREIRGEANPNPAPTPAATATTPASPGQPAPR